MSPDENSTHWDEWAYQQPPEVTPVVRRVVTWISHVNGDDGGSWSSSADAYRDAADSIMHEAGPSGDRMILRDSWQAMDTEQRSDRWAVIRDRLARLIRCWNEKAPDGD